MTYYGRHLQNRKYKILRRRQRRTERRPQETRAGTVAKFGRVLSEICEQVSGVVTQPSLDRKSDDQHAAPSRHAHHFSAQTSFVRFVVDLF